MTIDLTLLSGVSFRGREITSRRLAPVITRPR